MVELPKPVGLPERFDLRFLVGLWRYANKICSNACFFGKKNRNLQLRS
jgi:hypothetical protein